MDAVERAAKRCNTTVKEMFRQATEAMGFTNGTEVLAHRYHMWQRYGEIPPYVERYCTGERPQAVRKVEVH